MIRIFALLFSILIPAACQGEGAIFVGREKGITSVVPTLNFWDGNAAVADARARCEAGKLTGEIKCELAAILKGNCAAVHFTKDAYTVALGDSKSEAETNALALCRARGQTCGSANTSCDSKSLTYVYKIGEELFGFEYYIDTLLLPEGMNRIPIFQFIILFALLMFIAHSLDQQMKISKQARLIAQLRANTATPTPGVRSVTLNNPTQATIEPAREAQVLQSLNTTSSPRLAATVPRDHSAKQRLENAVRVESESVRPSAKVDERLGSALRNQEREIGISSSLKLIANAPTYVVLYLLFMVPTYLLPYVGSNSAALNAYGKSVGIGFNPAFWWHLVLLLILCVLAWARGSYVAKTWLIVFPIIASVFDLIAGLNLVPFVPTFMHLCAIIVGVSSQKAAV
jgi:hypothetical protein